VVSAAVESSLQNLLQRPDIWRLQDRGRALSAAMGLPTGFAALDDALYGGGWPRAALTELLTGQCGIGELELLLPALTELSRQQLLQVWINPPFIPYAPALVQSGIALSSVLIVRTEAKQQLWACEQALRSAACGAVLYWPSTALRYPELRKLQVAASAQQGLAFLMRPPLCAAQTSPAVLRLQLNAGANNQLAVQILKQRGTHSGQMILLPRSTMLSAQMPLRERAGFVVDEEVLIDSIGVNKTGVDKTFIDDHSEAFVNIRNPLANQYRGARRQSLATAKPERRLW
jgi:hypothetical protein